VRSPGASCATSASSAAAPKVARIYEALVESQIPAEMLHKVHAPIGLDIGAVTPRNRRQHPARLIAVLRQEHPATALDTAPIAKRTRERSGRQSQSAQSAIRNVF
jgi:hypothetical protein